MRRRKRRWHHRRNYAAQHVAIDDFIAAIGWVSTAEVRRIGPAWRRLLAYMREHPERYTGVLRRIDGRWTQTWQMREQGQA